jgi:hypothetical protein
MPPFSTAEQFVLGAELRRQMYAELGHLVCQLDSLRPRSGLKTTAVRRTAKAQRLLLTLRSQFDDSHLPQSSGWMQRQTTDTGLFWGDARNPLP